jgi:4-amino-4-deoxy-L-arabinose transferase-like glycosyltransferase
VSASPSLLDRRWWWTIGLLAILTLALALRLEGIHDPLLDHPGWRQGDTASIARNFYRLQYNIMYPQTDYDGPPPNYVELELQIVPFMAATLYKFFGVHPIFGRLISIAFSLGAVALCGFFARWLFGSLIAGLSAAFFFAIFPGSLYYGRTFTPDTAMVFFLIAALYATARFLTEDEFLAPRALARTTALVTIAYLAKPVAVAGIVPIVAMIGERARAGRTLRISAAAVLLFAPLVILYAYDRNVRSHAEWQWASGITRLHVIPGFVASVTSVGGLLLKLSRFREVLGMLRATMLGTIPLLLGIAGFAALPWIHARSKTLLWGWLAGGLLYTYVVVTVERVDYYMYLLLPLWALVIGGLIAKVVAYVRSADAAPPARAAVLALIPVVAFASLLQSRAAVRPYYAYSKTAYRNAVALSHTLAPGALVVVGHYGPDVMYYIDRYGWEEDPYLWTPFDEESAIRKGARYFVAVEKDRFYANVELCAWMQRFPVMNPHALWPVYVTDPAHELPGADRFWRAFRIAERAGNARAFLNAHGVCRK